MLVLENKKDQWKPILDQARAQLPRRAPPPLLLWPPGGGGPSAWPQEYPRPDRESIATSQGLLALVKPLSPPPLAAIITATAAPTLILALDQVTDPRNCGAILRSAAAFGVTAVVTPHSHSAPETAALARSASGGLDLVPFCQTPNLVHALKQLRKEGYWVIGLAAQAEKTLADVVAHVTAPSKIVLVVGSEERGLRRLTSCHCDFLAAIPTPGRLAQLNVSVAAAIALYALCNQ